MWGSVITYAGLAAAATGLGLLLGPAGRRRPGARERAAGVTLGGLALAGTGLLLPARESRVSNRTTRLDEVLPAWHFREVHTRSVAAPVSRVFEAITQIRADEILLFRTLAWIRRGGRPLPPGILNPGIDEPVIDVATRNGFVRLAHDPPRELVVGTIVIAPTGSLAVATPETFRAPLPPGFALAAMNFLVTPEGPDATLVSTETRVFASSAGARRRFAAYWRFIYPGSALIRRMWLRAIAQRASRATR